MNSNLENHFITLFVTIIFLAGLIGIFSLANGCGLFAFIKSIWDYFFNKWEITIKETGSETWVKKYSDDVFNKVKNQHGKEIPGSEYERSFVVYLYKHKFNKEEKLVKKYLD